MLVTVDVNVLVEVSIQSNVQAVEGSYTVNIQVTSDCSIAISLCVAVEYSVAVNVQAVVQGSSSVNV